MSVQKKLSKKELNVLTENPPTVNILYRFGSSLHSSCLE